MYVLRSLLTKICVMYQFGTSFIRAYEIKLTTLTGNKLLNTSYETKVTTKISIWKIRAYEIISIWNNRLYIRAYEIKLTTKILIGNKLLNTSGYETKVTTKISIWNNRLYISAYEIIVTIVATKMPN